jgi:hypothetical protein
MNFSEALILMNKGKSVRRKVWPEDHYWNKQPCFNPTVGNVPKTMPKMNLSFRIFSFSNCDKDGYQIKGTGISNILAEDWEIYKPDTVGSIAFVEEVPQKKKWTLRDWFFIKTEKDVESGFDKTSFRLLTEDSKLEYIEKMSDGIILYCSDKSSSSKGYNRISLTVKFKTDQTPHPSELRFDGKTLAEVFDKALVFLRQGRIENV